MSEPAKNTEMLQLASQAVQRMRLDDIALVQSAFNRAVELPQDDEGEFQCGFKFRVEHSYNSESGDLTVFVEYSARGEFAREEAPDQDVFLVTATFLASYTMLDGDETLPPPVIAAFSKLNGVFNSWPYWREFLQNMTARMSIPPVTLPLITAPAIVKILAEQAEKQKSSVQKKLPKKKSAKKKLNGE